MKRKIILGLGAAGTALALLPLFAAFEAHVINVTAKIENALAVSTNSIEFGTAGNAANVAVCASRLGLKTAIYTNLGDDDQGEEIKAALLKEGISPDYVKLNPGKKSNLSVVLTFQGERTIFVYHQDWFYSLPKLASSKWVYLTSMAETFTDSNIMNEVFNYIGSSHAKLAFGPGTYQLKADIKRFPKILASCDLLVVNMEEAKRIIGIEQDEPADPKNLLSKLLLLGPKIAVVTDGGEGSYACDGGRNLRVGIFPTQAYAGALISALCIGLSLDEAMVWGAINASHVIQEVGAQKGLMNRDELERHSKAMPELKAVPF